DGHKLHRVVIGQHTIGAEGAAAAAAVDNRPLPFSPDPDSHRLHNAAAVAFTVSRFNVHVEAMETVRAVIPMVASGPGRNHQAAAVFAGKALVAGVVLVVTFFV